MYDRRFHKRAPDCCDLVDEEVLLNVRHHVMMEEYRIFLENLSLSYFSRWMEVARRRNVSVGKISRCSNVTFRSSPID